MFFSKNFEYPLADEWCDVFPTSKSRCSFHARNRSPDLEKPTLTAKFIAVVVARDLYVLDSGTDKADRESADLTTR